MYVALMLQQHNYLQVIDSLFFQLLDRLAVADYLDVWTENMRQVTKQQHLEPIYCSFCAFLIILSTICWLTSIRCLRFLFDKWLLRHIIWPLVKDIEELSKAGLPLTRPLNEGYFFFKKISKTR